MVQWKIKRTINEVLDMETGECIDANDFFRKNISDLTVFRSELNRAIEGFRQPLFTCYYCKQKIKIRGGNTRGANRKEDIFHFAHLNDSENCAIKTNHNFTKDEVDRIKYNGAKESILHQKIKGNIAEFLNCNLETKKEISDIEVEKIVRNAVSKSWKKPDINAYFLDKRMAIELQLSTTWLSVITQRQEFYKNQGIYIFWVFRDFDENDYQRKLTINDVVYTNNQNAYVFDDEAVELSKQANDFILKCYFKTYFRNEMELGERWDNEFIKLSDLTFDSETFKVFFRDTEKQKKVIYQEIDDYLRLPEIVKIKKEDEKKTLELSIENLELKIEKIKTDNQENIFKERKFKERIDEQKRYVEKKVDYSDMIILYFSFSETIKFPKLPFKDNNLLIKKLREKFGDRLHIVTKSLSNNYKKKQELPKEIFGVTKIEFIQVGRKLYILANTNSDWNFIKENYSQMKIIKASAVNTIYAEEAMGIIDSEYDFNKHYKGQTTTHFLINVESSRLEEFEFQNRETQKIINQQENLKATIFEEIKGDETKRIIEEYCQKKINSLEANFKKEKSNQLDRDSDLPKKREELIKQKRRFNRLFIQSP